MPGVNATIAVSIDAKLSGSGDLGTPRVSVDVEKVLEFAAGTAAIDQANILFSDTRTLIASATEDLDLAAVLADALGAVFTAAEIVVIYVEAAAGNTNNVNVIRPAANGFIGPFLAASDGLAVAPGMPLLLVNRNGWAVTATTGDLLTFTNSAGGTPVTYNIVIIGRTVAA